jgi:biotin transport system substrate-specific component
LIASARGSFFLTFGLLILGDLVLLSCGTIWLKFLLGYSLSKALLLGLLPFLPGDLLKAALAAAVYLHLRPRLKQIF